MSVVAVNPTPRIAEFAKLELWRYGTRGPNAS
jgi:hypothetical protein